MTGLPDLGGVTFPELAVAEVAERIGLINRALPDDKLDSYVEGVALRIALFNPEAVRRVEADAGVAAVVLMLCDQPFVTAEVLAGLLDTYRKTGSRIVASRYDGSFGVPALFSKEFFVDLIRLEDEAGAKNVIQRNLPEVHMRLFPRGGIDVDTPGDFARLLSTDDR